MVTGAGGGIGRALAVGLSSRGARLALVGRRPDPLRETAELAGGPALVLPCDVSDAGAVAGLCDRVEAELGEVEVLVNNAGRGAYGPFQEVPLADHRAVVDTNLMGVVHVTHRVLPSMLRRGRGQLVFVSSVLGELPSPDHAVYGATKFAVTGLGESLAHELHGTGVSVTVVEPGLVHSGFHQVSGTPMERFGQVPSKSCGGGRRRGPGRHGAAAAASRGRPLGGPGHPPAAPGAAVLQLGLPAGLGSDAPPVAAPGGFVAPARAGAISSEVRRRAAAPPPEGAGRTPTPSPPRRRRGGRTPARRRSCPPPRLRGPREGPGAGPRDR